MKTTIADDNELIKSIASETNTPAEVVQKLYADTFAEFAEGATIRDFVPLFAAKRVRSTLREAQQKLH